MPTRPRNKHMENRMSKHFITTPGNSTPKDDQSRLISATTGAVPKQWLNAII